METYRPIPGGAQVTTYGYDSSDRLTKTAVVEAGKTVTSEYGYDAVANRALETVTTATGGVTTATSKAYTYDSRNALKTIVDSTAGTITLTYDQQGSCDNGWQGGCTKYTFRR